MTDSARTIVLDDSPESLERIVEHLHAGGVIAYPTETVYGYGSLVRADALQRLAALKARSAEKRFLVLVTERVIVPGLQWDAAASALADEFWPGPLTLALRAGPGTPQAALGPDGTVAVRCSPHPVPRRIIDEVLEPITSTSANASGQPPAMSAAEIVRALSGTDFSGDILVVDGGTLSASASSTIVSFAGARARLVRPGAIAADEIRRIVGDLDE
jgi:L-threonylcarbamoyladenylate synthase